MMKRTIIAVLTFLLLSSVALAGWVTGSRGATIASATADAKKFVDLLFSDGRKAAAVSLYDDLPADKLAALKRDPPQFDITGDPVLIQDILAGMYRTQIRQRLIESRSVVTDNKGERAYEFVFSVKAKSDQPLYAVVFLSYAGFGTEHGSRQYRVTISTKKPGRKTTVSNDDRSPNQPAQPTHALVTCRAAHAPRQAPARLA